MPGMIPFQTVGHPLPRADGPDKVGGRALYTADVVLPGTLWGKLLRGPFPHARIVSIDASAARQAPGVHAVLTARDLPDPSKLIGRRLKDLPILAHDRVRFIGEPVAAVAAETADAAEAALGLIEVEYEELPSVLDPSAALAPGAQVIHPELAGYAGLPADRPADAPPNLQGSWHAEQGDLAAGLAAADLVFEATYTTPPVHQGYLEPHAVLAHAQADGSLDVWLTNKTPFTARDQLAAALDLPVDQVRVHPAALGGDFGGKGSLMAAPVAALLSRASGRPVRIVLTYVEELMAGNPRHAARIRLRTGAQRDGTLTALEAEMVLDGGAYAAFKPHQSLIVGGISRIAGPYRVPHVSLTARVAYTNTVPRGHMRSPGEPQAVFARELHLDELARRLGLDPLELRRRNLLHDGEARPTGGHWSHPTAHTILERAAEAIGWAEPRQPNVGRGLAISERGIGVGRSNARLRLDSDGTAELLTGLPDTGTGAHTVLRQVVAEVLGLDPDRVGVRIGGTDEAPEDSGAGGSRVTHVAGQAAQRAAIAAAEQVGQLGAELFGWPEGAVVLRDGRVGPREGFEDAAVPIESIVQRAGGPIVADGSYETDERYPEQSVTVQAARVRVDPETGQVRVERLVSAHDVGTVLNPLTHQGQIEGGLIQALGMALMEEVAISADEGRVGTLSLGDYKLPAMPDAPPLETVLVPGGHGPAPFDSKAIGEASNSALAPAIAAAVLDAVGAAIRDLPITAEKVLNRLDERAGDSRSEPRA